MQRDERAVSENSQKLASNLYLDCKNIAGGHQEHLGDDKKNQGDGQGINECRGPGDVTPKGPILVPCSQLRPTKFYGRTYETANQVLGYSSARLQIRCSQD